MKKIILYIVIFAVMLCFSCRDVVDLNRPEDYSFDETWGVAFESYWTGMNNNYLFWDIDPTDWDAVYREYQPKFAALGDSDENFEKAYKYFQEITKDLVDGHHELTISDGKGNEKLLIPSYARYFREHGLDMYEYIDSDYDIAILEKSPSYTKSDLYVEDFFNPNLALQKAVTARFAQETGSEYTTASIGSYIGTYDVVPIKMAAGRLPVEGGFILYFQLTRFCHYEINKIYRQLETVYAEIDAANTTGKSDEYLLANLEPSAAGKKKLALEIRITLKTMQLYFDGLKDPNLKGVILDLRGNTGGEILSLSWLWGHFISSEHTFAYTRTKLGDNRLDYTPWLPVKIFPAPDGAELKVPIVALVNKYSASAAEWSAMIISSLPNGYVVGGTTLGMFGSPQDSRNLNGGSFYGLLFSVSNGANETKYLDGVNYEGKGFPPDIFVPFDYDALQAGTDTRLEAAIRCVLEHQ
jgi:hypothetical protein